MTTKPSAILGKKLNGKINQSAGLGRKKKAAPPNLVIGFQIVESICLEFCFDFGLSAEFPDERVDNSRKCGTFLSDFVTLRKDEVLAVFWAF